MKKNYIGLLRRKETTSIPKKNGWLTGAFAAAALLLGSSTFAQTNVASYAFAKSTGATYTSISGGTKLFPTGTNTTYDNEISSAITLSSPFTYGGVAVSTVYVSANGYITFGAAPAGTNYTPLSTTITGGTGVVSAFAQDAGASELSGAVPVVSYLDTPSEFIVQYADHANYFNRTTEKLNFQIRLNYATGVISIVYGACTNPGTSTSGSTVQVGIRGNDTTFATNVNNLQSGNIPAATTCDWSKAVTGFANSSTMLFSAGTNANVKIPAGLQYTWSPGTQLPVRTFAATTAVTSGGATVNWTAPAGATGYNVQYRDISSCDWTNFVGNPVSGNSATLTGLAQNTTYQVQVQALNGSLQSIYSHIPNLAGTGTGYVAAGSFTTLANCASTVTGLTSSALTPNGATISWTASTTPPANGYEYYYSTSSTAPTSTTTPSGSVGAGIVTANLTGLIPGALYYYWVRANCNGIDKGVWSSSASFTALSLCPTVTAPAANATGVALTPTITWTAINGVTGYRLKVGTTSGGTDIVNDVDLGNVTTYTFPSPLNSSTKYFYSVTGYTPTTAAPVTACAVRNFTTICNVISTFPWTENFDSLSPIGASILPNCWSTITGTYAFTSSNAASNTYNDPRSGSNYMTLYYNSSASTLWTPGFQLTAGTSYDFVFYFAGDGYSGWTGDVLQNTSQIATGATVLGTSFITSTVTSTANAYTKVTRTIVPSTSGTYYFGVKVSSNSTPYYLGFDDFSLLPTPTCVEPTAVSSGNATTGSALISWTAPASAPANGYEVYYSTSNTAPTDSTVLNASNSTTSTSVSATINGLSASTVYYAWVRSVCSGTDKSVWSSATSFTTLCNPSTVPFTENFNSGSIASCWSTYSTNNTSYALWQFGSATQDYGTTYSAAGQNNTAGQYAFVDASSPYTGVHDVTLLSPLVNLTGLVVPTLEFRWFKNHGSVVNPTSQPAYDNNKLTVEVKDVNSSTWETVFTSTSNLPTWRAESIALPASYVGKTIQVRFVVDKDVAGAGYFYDNLLLDDVSLKEAANLATTEVKSTSSNLKIYPNPFTDLLTISDIKNVKSIMISDISGKVVRTIAKPESTLHLGDLNSGMYLVILNMNDGSRQTIKAIKK